MFHIYIYILEERRYDKNGTLLTITSLQACYLSVVADWLEINEKKPRVIDSLSTLAHRGPLCQEFHCLSFPFWSFLTCIYFSYSIGFRNSS
jgi:hypothetical protein